MRDDSSSKAQQASSFNSLDSLRFANGRPGVAATLKQEFDDFCVDERLGFELTGKGEHLYLRVAKTDLSTVEVAKRLSEVSGVPKSAVGYSGMKDRRAETRQWFSIKLPESGSDRLGSFESESLKILESQRNSRKLRIGSHRSNHFRILLRDCQGERAEFEERLGRILSEGVPNYFGGQRFGRGLSNLHQVQAWMAAELDPDAQSGDGAGPIAGQRFKRGMLFSAARAYVFNQLLSRRLELGNWDRYVAGDVLNLDGTERCFVVDESTGWDQTLERRLREFDIHLTGPLPGAVDAKDKYVSYGKAADIEDAVCEQFTTLLAGLTHFDVKAARRPLRFRPIDLQWRWLDYGEPEGGSGDGESTGPAGNLSLDFSLGKGAYATSLLRELCVCREHGQ